MNYAKVIFNNGFELKVNEDTIFSGIRKQPNKLTYPQPGLNDMHEHQFPFTSSHVDGLEIFYHSSAGFIPSITDILLNYEFFAISDSNDSVYASNSVFKIVNL